MEVFHELDFGEIAAICHAVEHGADIVLLDERDRRRVARRHGIDVIGVIRILLRGAKVDEVDLECELDDLRARALPEAREYPDQTCQPTATFDEFIPGTRTPGKRR